MTFKLSPQLEKYIDDQVKAGRYRSPDEALEAGVARLMLDPEPEVLDQQDLIELQQSIDQMRRSEVLDATELHATLRSRFLKNA